MNRTLILLAFSFCFLAGLAWSRLDHVAAQFGPQKAKGCCDQWTASGTGVAGGPDSFLVDADFNLNGPIFGGPFNARTIQVKSTARLLSQSLPATDGTINVLTSHVFEVKGRSDEDGECEPDEDCMVTLDRAALIQTATPGLMKLRSTLAVSDGQGRFAKACGKAGNIEGEGEINFAAPLPTVRWTMSGHLCQCP